MRLCVLGMLTLSLAGLVGVQASAQLAESTSSDQSSSDRSLQPTLPEQTTSASTESAVDESRKDDKEKDSAPEKTKFRWRLGGVSVGAGYMHASRPFFYPYAAPYFYAPFGYFPGDWVAASYWYPLASPYPFYAPGGFSYTDGRGQLRLTAEPKAAEVYIDGGYAGTADKLKSLWLDPGPYDLTLSAAAHEDFHQRVYVLSGKSLKITAKLNPETSKEKP